MSRPVVCEAVSQLLEVMKTLRSPAGCAWDARQTPASLAPYVLEEAAEVVEAIEGGDPAAVKDEAGDLLLQVVFLAQIYSEEDHFDFADIARTIAEKLIRRHPHVFAEAARNQSEQELTRQWERIKRAEKSSTGDPAHPLGQVPVHLPALQRAHKVLERADKVGLLARVEKNASHCGEGEFDEEALGSQLFSLVCRAYRANLDAEQVLRRKVRQILQDMEDLPMNKRSKERS